MGSQWKGAKAMDLNKTNISPYERWIWLHAEYYPVCHRQGEPYVVKLPCSSCFST
jgi:hypothetical protein